MNSSDIPSDFEYWLIHMDDALDEFLAGFSGHGLLDFTSTSLDIVEDHLLATYKNVDAVIAPSQSRTIDGYARYVGETFRKSLGWKWEIRFDDPKYAYHGLPQLVAHANQPCTPICPLTLISACVDRRKGNFLSTIFHNTLNREEKKRSQPGHFA